MAVLSPEHPALARYVALPRALPLGRDVHAGTRLPRPAHDALVIVRPTAIAMHYAALHWARDVVVLVEPGPLGEALSALINDRNIDALAPFWPNPSPKLYDSCSWSEANCRLLRGAYQESGATELWLTYAGLLVDIDPTTPATWLVDLADADPGAWFDAHLEWFERMSVGTVHILSTTPWDASAPLRRIAGAERVLHIATLTAGPAP